MIHVGRAFTGTAIEDKCPCPKAPCGLVANGLDSCAQHGFFAAKTMRQIHLAKDCKGAPDAQG